MGKNGHILSLLGRILGPYATKAYVDGAVADVSGGTGAGGLPTGGTADQFLKKASGTDYDAVFSDVAIGDVTGLRTELDAIESDLSDASDLAQTAYNKADLALTTANGAVSGLSIKADLNSPALTGTPTAPTAAAGTNTTQISTCAFVRGEVAALVNAAPSTLDTLGEIATQLASDESAAAALATTVAGKLAKASNLSDLANVATARTNLGLGTLATQNANAVVITGGSATNFTLTSGLIDADGVVIGGPSTGGNASGPIVRNMQLDDSTTTGTLWLGSGGMYLIDGSGAASLASLSIAAAGDLTDLLAGLKTACPGDNNAVGGIDIFYAGELHANSVEAVAAAADNDVFPARFQFRNVASGTYTNWYVIPYNADVVDYYAEADASCTVDLEWAAYSAGTPSGTSMTGGSNLSLSSGLQRNTAPTPSPISKTTFVATNMVRAKLVTAGSATNVNVRLGLRRTL